MPSNHLILCCPLFLLLSIFPSIRVFSNESALCIRWPKYWSFSIRWCATVVAEGDGVLHPVAHLTLRDLDWLEDQLRMLSDGGVRTAMIGSHTVDGKPLSHPDLDRAWSAFVEHGVSPC